MELLESRRLLTVGISISVGGETVPSNEGVDFGTVGQGDTPPTLTFTVHNTGDESLPIRGFRIFNSGGDPFSPDDDTFEHDFVSPDVIAIDDTRQFTVTLSTAEPIRDDGSWSSDLEIFYGYANDFGFFPAYRVDLSATVLPDAPGELTVEYDGNVFQDGGSGSGLSVDFGSIFDSDPRVTRTVLLRNTGGEPITIDGFEAVPAAGEYYSIDEDFESEPLTLAPGDTYPLVVTCGEGEGPLNSIDAHFTLFSNDFHEPLFVVPVRGTILPDPSPAIEIPVDETVEGTVDGVKEGDGSTSQVKITAAQTYAFNLGGDSDVTFTVTDTGDDENTGMTVRCALMLDANDDGLMSQAELAGAEIEFLLGSGVRTESGNKGLEEGKYLIYLVPHSMSEELEPKSRTLRVELAVVGTPRVDLTGTLGNDVILVSAIDDGFEVDFNGLIQTYPSTISGFFIDASSGDDRVVVNANVNLPVAITGSGGNDTIVGGSGDDELSGANGKDRILGGAGDDFLLGGAFDDYVNGEAGDDLVLGAGGRDKVHAGSGNNWLIGGSGNDVLFANPASIDTISGNTGFDTGVNLDDGNDGTAALDIIAGIEERVRLT